MRLNRSNKTMKLQILPKMEIRCRCRIQSPRRKNLTFSARHGTPFSIKRKSLKIAQNKIQTELRRNSK